MKKVNVPTDQMSKFYGKWVAIDTVHDRIVAVGETLEDIEPFVSRKTDDPTPDEQIPAAFKVPREDEGPYILWITKQH